MKKTIVVLSLIALPAIGQQAPLETGVLDRETLIEEVLERNGAVAAARSSLEAYRNRVEIAGELADPRMALAIAPLSLDGGSVGARAMVTQEFPLFGRLDARTTLARSEAELARLSLEELKVALALETSRLYDRWYLIHRAIALNAHHHDLAEQLKASAETQYVAGVAGQHDPLQAEVRLATLERELLDLEAEARKVRAEINSLLRRSPGAELAAPPELLPLPPVPPVAASEMLASALGTSLEAETARKFVDRSVAIADLAELELKPDVEAMAEVSSMMPERDNRFVIGVSFRLPVRRDRLEAEIAAAKAERRSAEEMLQQVEAEVAFELERALSDLDEAVEAVALYENVLIPASRDRADAARIAFSTARTSFFTLLEAEASLEETLLAFHAALTDAWEAFARLEAAMGRIPFVEGVAHE